MRLAVLIGLFALLATTSFAQENKPSEGAGGQGELTFNSDGQISLDVEQLMQGIGGTQPADVEITGLNLNTPVRYCIQCSDGREINCSSPIGGEVGRVFCGTRGIVQCTEGTVDYGRC